MPDQGNQVDNIILNQMNTNKKEIRDDIAKLGSKVDTITAENAKQNRRMDAHGRAIGSNKKAIGRGFNEIKSTWTWGKWITGVLILCMISVVGYIGGAEAIVNWIGEIIGRIIK